ncbi:MAG: ATP-grasp domain-containing protein [Gammaproteobacteria bacterium]
MNLLVTNTRNTQAYSIIRALRPHARKIAATMEGDNRLAARLSHAANSRLVDKRYYTPSPAEDWREGRIQRENTEKEESYIQTVLQICEAEKIDTIFPSFDPQIYVFAKNKERLEKMGILIPIPDYETVIIPLDKYRTILAAQEVEFPCPKTYLPESGNDLRRIVAELGFPLVVKPRFTSGGRGTSIVRDFGELSAKIQQSWSGPSPAMVQEYIPGTEKQQFYLVLDKTGDLKMSFCPKTHRLFDRLYRNSSAASESSLPHPMSAEAAGVARRMGWWGSITLQTKVDPRDGLPKLLEANPRLGHHLWYRTAVAINEPLMCLQIAREATVAPIESYPIGTMFLSPIEDVLSFGFGLLDRWIYTLRTRLLAARSLDPLSVPPSCKELFQSYGRTYFNRQDKSFDPYFTNCRQDPVVSFLWWLKFSYQVMSATKHLGR